MVWCDDCVSAMERIMAVGDSNGGGGNDKRWC